jgi:hypothetical protein
MVNVCVGFIYNVIYLEHSICSILFYALQNEIGRKLSDHQIHHATNSIRKATLYIENVLDGKFIPHGSYGINHTKHNLEYGYLIVGLMQPSKRKTTTKK